MVNKTRFFGVFSGIGLRTCGQRIRYRDEHGRIFAGRILGLVVFRSHVAALLMQLDKREFSGPGDAVSLNVLNRDAFHGGRHSQILNASRNPAKPGLEFAVTDIRGPGSFWHKFEQSAALPSVSFPQTTSATCGWRRVREWEGGEHACRYA